MKFRYQFLSLALILMFLLSSCGDATTEASNSPSDSPSNNLSDYPSDYPSDAPSEGSVITKSITFRSITAHELGTNQDWQKSLSVAAGTSIVLQIEFANFETENLLKTGLALSLPEELTVIPDTTYLWNMFYLEGIGYTDDDDGIAITTVGINLGDYPGVTDQTEAGQPGSNAFVRCNIQIADDVQPGTELVINANAVANGADTGTVYITTGNFIITII